MTGPLAPKLTRLDERVLAELRRARGKRAGDVARALAVGEGTQRRKVVAPADREREVREVLRGLAAVGLAVERGGWWRLPVGATMRVKRAEEAVMETPKPTEPHPEGAQEAAEEMPLREEDVMREDALDDRVVEEELPEQP